MNGRAWPIARILGIEIRVHISWIPVLALIILGTALYLGTAAPEIPPPIQWFAGGVVGLLFLASIIVHELAHSLVARRRGLAVLPITIVFFGGISALEQEAQRPSDEAAVAAAGPLASLALGGGLLTLAAAIGEASLAVALGAGVVAAVNLALGAINLIPGLPLDGGRILRAIVWQATGDAQRGARVAGRVGRMIGAIVIVAGFLVSVVGDGATGAMAILSGWFLLQGSRVMERRAAIEALVAGVRVDEVMEKDVPAITPNLTVDSFADQLLGDDQATSVPVVSGDALVGLIGVSQLRRIARRKWSELRAVDVMVARPALPSLAASDDLWAGLELLRRSGLDGVPVMAGPALLGVLTRRAVAAAIQARVAAKPTVLP
jgi:Zn-dependent protease/predicted transcriptional regulator